jgi:hypothetical protein
VAWHDRRIGAAMNGVMRSTPAEFDARKPSNRLAEHQQFAIANPQFGTSLCTHPYRYCD